MPGTESVYGPGQFPASEDEHAKLLEWGMTNFNAAERARQPLEQRWRRYNRLYRSYVKRKDGDWRSRRFIPICFYTVESVLPKLVAQLPSFIAKPVGPEDVAAAPLVEDLLAWAREESKLYLQLVRSYKSALKFGTGILKTYNGARTGRRRVREQVMEPLEVPFSEPEIDPETGQPMMDLDGAPMMRQGMMPLGEIPTGRYTERVEPFTYYQGPMADAVDIFNFWPAPDATDLDDARYVIHRVFRDHRYLQAKISDGTYRLPSHISAEQLLSTEAEPHLEREAEVEAGVGVDPTSRKVELLEFWTDEAVMTVANRTAVIRVEENPFDHGDKPFVRVVDHLQEHAFWGVGEIEPLEGIQDALNDLVNLRIDNVKLVLNRVFAVDPGNLVDLRDLELRPGRAIRVNSKDIPPGEVLAAIEFPDITQSAYVEAAELERFAEKISGVSGYTTGSDAASLGDASDTATGVALISEQGNTRFSMKVKMAELTGLADLARHYGSNLQQFAPPELVVRREGPRGGYEWQQISAEGIQGALDYEIEAESSTLTESMRREQDMGLLQALAGFLPPTGVLALVEDVLRDWGKKDIDRYMAAPPLGAELAPEAPAGVMQSAMAPEPVP